MSEWLNMETAPKDGTVIKVKRVFEGGLIYEGLACWRTVKFPALPPHPLSGDIYAPAEDATGWMRHDSEHRVPEPTHWMPAAPTPAPPPPST